VRDYASTALCYISTYVAASSSTFFPYRRSSDLVHTGTPLLTEEGYVGPDVHRAARIAAAGHGGQVLDTAATRQLEGDGPSLADLDRKSTRLNSSHQIISYAVFCLKKKKRTNTLK